jgi:formate/nitrite transporter FocA (FNT family)
MPNAGASSPALDSGQQEQAASHAAPQALVIHEIVREEGEVELKRRPAALAWSGLAAGLSMGFSFLVLALFRNGLPDTPWRPLVASLGYSVGFVIVILGRQQLFTESTLTAVLPVLTRRDGRTLLATLRLWAIVLATNLLGTILFAAVVSRPGIFRPELFHALEELAQETVDGPFWPVLVKSVFAGWLIALMVWLLPSAHSARLFVIVILTYVVSLAGLSHIVAGSAEAAFAVFTGHAAVSDYILGFMVPTLIGNTIGGVSLVALLNHAPLAPEMQDASTSE